MEVDEVSGSAKWADEEGGIRRRRPTRSFASASTLLTVLQMFRGLLAVWVDTGVIHEPVRRLT